MTYLRQALFHLKEFSTTPYFLMLLVTGTVAASITQRLGVYAWGADPYLAMLRSFAVGMWTSSIAAAGIIGFERRKGTLVYLVSGRSDPFLAILAAIVPTATFGLLALPLALICWLAPGSGSLSPGVVLAHCGQILLGALALWLSLLTVTFVISAIFVLSSNATTYEGLLLVPALYCSGLFASPSSPSLPLLLAQYVFPPNSAIRLLYGANSGIASMLWQVLICLVLCLLWFALAWKLWSMALAKARQQASLEVI